MESDETQISPLKEEDHCSLLECLRELILFNRPFDNTASQISGEEMLTQMGESTVFVAKAGASVVGFCSIVSIEQINEANPAEITRHAFLTAIFVKKNFRSRGIGSRLMESIRGWATCASVSSLSLHVYAANVEATEFYRALGFEIGSFLMRKNL